MASLHLVRRLQHAGLKRWASQAYVRALRRRAQAHWSLFALLSALRSLCQHWRHRAIQRRAHDHCWRAAALGALRSLCRHWRCQAIRRRAQDHHRRAAALGVLRSLRRHASRAEIGPRHTTRSLRQAFDAWVAHRRTVLVTASLLLRSVLAGWSRGATGRALHTWRRRIARAKAVVADSLTLQLRLGARTALLQWASRCAARFGCFVSLPPSPCNPFTLQPPHPATPSPCSLIVFPLVRPSSVLFPHPQRPGCCAVCACRGPRCVGTCSSVAGMAVHPTL